MFAKPLIELLTACGVQANAPFSDVLIKGITADSRHVKPGFVFVAVPGVAGDGAQYIPQAVAAGAVAVVIPSQSVMGEPSASPASQRMRCDADVETSTADSGHAPHASDSSSRSGGIKKDVGVPVIATPNPRLVLAKMAAAFYGAQPKHIAAITGTDGKTSTADFFRQLSEMLGHKAASIGTLGVLGEGRAEIAPGGNTTPDPVSLAAQLAALAAEGYTHIGMEASSHGLHQYRLDGVRVEAAAFTNITRDHLDYHGTEEAYFQAKLRLFSEVIPTHSTIVVNGEDKRLPEIQKVAGARRLRLIRFGKGAQELSIVRMNPTPEGQEVHLDIFGRFHAVQLPLVGNFQVYNMLAALGLLSGMGESAHRIVPLFEALACVPGRLERVSVARGAAAYIDYAHTPAALANVLATLRPHTHGRLIVVFGCGGDRDRGKRPLMAEAAGKLADHVIITDDNPRSEEAAAIRAEVRAGFPAAKEVAGRAEAIYGAVEMLAAGDVLLVAGKGHEKTQIIGTESHPFDDAEEIRKAFSAL